MKKYNLFDNFICLLVGAIIGIFLYINFFTKNNKELETTQKNNKQIEIINEIKKPVENIKYINLTDFQKLDLIKKIKNNLINYNTSNYLYKKDINSFFESFII
ncbi:hypothetical protein PSOLA_00400 [Candidatus Phytoplasma solani]|uniref:hypothetical protein n=1 Tax=Candidatus Phytoplasma solani TaxID=69896 RepID=UPI0003B7BEE4|nr:hypothetical protein [Candidatus Phytoplasma solani]CCP88046.1 conserved hypothetical protein [Candidatus Phytoplasma solani]